MSEIDCKQVVEETSPSFSRSLMKCLEKGMVFSFWLRNKRTNAEPYTVKISGAAPETAFGKHEMVVNIKGFRMKCWGSLLQFAK